MEALPDGRYLLGEVVVRALDGKFPDFRKLLPASVTGEPAIFNPALLVRCQNELREWDGVKECTYRIDLNDDTGVPVIRSPKQTAVCLVMPYHPKAVPEVGTYAAMRLPPLLTSVKAA